MQAEAPKMLEKEGKEVPGNRGYRYYGAARDLPGVRELFEEDRKSIFDSFIVFEKPCITVVQLSLITSSQLYQPR